MGRELLMLVNFLVVPDNKKILPVDFELMPENSKWLHVILESLHDNDQRDFIHMDIHVEAV